MVRPRTDPNACRGGTGGPFLLTPGRTNVHGTRRRSSHRSEIVQGKPVARRGRKARDLSSEAARPPRRSAVHPKWERENCEGDPGALHLGRHGARRHGPDARRWRSVVLAMKDIIKAGYFRLLLTVMALASSALVLEARQRWK